ncbi:Lysine transporter [Limosilactobacillus gastricus PS3]|uniref:Lysine transporter n=1 Tax=Limosilactobacillus gastricus PS3 TaxID=1144300 RepID=H4GJ57_9LACO|nr:amino acid permease [Limosilactobacillus gastricus]EHS87082.1 Lysine transporter [Limosilactobacillus gastricus PS3]
MATDTSHQQGGEIKRSLQSRHLSMIALGGSIGTGLFIASGSAITTAGPGGALVAYAVMGIMVYFLMTSLAEMATYIPLSGSFAAYATKFVSPAMGFALGWNYWLNCAITVPVEVTTAGLVMNFWFPHIPSWIFSAVVFALIFLINVLSVKSYGETEFWLALVKVVTVIVFLIVGVLVILGIMGGQGPVGLENFTYKKAPFVNGFSGILSVFLVAGFSFQGTEMVGIAAGESADPEKSVPRAIHSTFWRILLFYICTIFVIACILPYTNPNLLSSDVKDIVTSPFTLVFKRAGLAAAASVMNAVILVAVLSSANSWMYASSRMLYSQAREGYAWKILGYIDKRGIPIYGLLSTLVIGILVWLTQFIGPEAYNYLIGASGLSGFIAWVGIAVSHWRFRRAFMAQGHQLSELKYHAALFPLGPILAFVLCLVVICGQNIDAFINMDWSNIAITYMTVPIFIILYIYYKVKYGSKLIPLKKVDLSRRTKGEAFEPADEPTGERQNH